MRKSNSGEAKRSSAESQKHWQRNPASSCNPEHLAVFMDGLRGWGLVCQGMRQRGLFAAGSCVMLG